MLWTGRLDFMQFLGSMIAPSHRMKRFRFLDLAALCSFSLLGAAHADVINAGSSVSRLVRIQNASGFGASELLLSTQGAGQDASLRIDLSGIQGDFSTRTAWYSQDAKAVGSNYTVSARFIPAAAQSELRGGVMGWLNVASSNGIAFYLNPAPDSGGFRLGWVDFLAETGTDNESVKHLFQLDGAAATTDVGSSVAALADYDPASYATLELQFAAPSAGELKALTNATAHVSARVYQGADTAGKPRQIGASLDLLTDLPFPSTASHRMGYFAYNGSIFADPGTIGSVRDLVGSGSITVDAAPVDPNPDPGTGTGGTTSLVYKYQDGKLIVSWPAEFKGYVLQVASSLLNPSWKEVAGSSEVVSVSLDTGLAGSYVRLVKGTTTPTPVTAPKISAAVQGTDLVLSWTGAGYRLETTADLLTPQWQTITSAGGTAKVALSAAKGFFRLVKP